jgi:hypothetical protein
MPTPPIFQQARDIAFPVIHGENPHLIDFISMLVHDAVVAVDDLS